jgi:hypothetical protein
VDESDFVVVRARRGRKTMAFSGEEKPLHPPQDRELIGRAIEWQFRLQAVAKDVA